MIFLVRDRRAVKNSPLALLLFCSSREWDAPIGHAKDVLNSPALRVDVVFLSAPAGRAQWCPE
jgi:hypothetical protein